MITSVYMAQALATSGLASDILYGSLPELLWAPLALSQSSESPGSKYTLYMKKLNGLPCFLVFLVSGKNTNQKSCILNYSFPSLISENGRKWISWLFSF